MSAAFSARKFMRLSHRAVPRIRVAFAQRLRELRRSHGWSQEGLGARAGLTGRFIGEVERGEKSISLDSLAHLARALRVPLAVMLQGL
jgi:transcriptional regulator with XRE-family HTH domain